MMELDKLFSILIVMTLSLAAVNSSKSPFPHRRRKCTYPRKGHALCPDGYKCKSVFKCQCECPSYAPSYCCPPSLKIPSTVQELQQILYETAKYDPIEGKKFGKLPAKIVFMVLPLVFPQKRKTCLAPYPGTAACPEGYKCENFLKCKCECPKYAPSLCCPPSIKPKSASELVILLEKAVQHGNQTQQVIKLKKVISPKKLSSAASNFLQEPEIPTWECLQFTKRFSVGQTTESDAQICHGKAINEPLSSTKSTFTITDELLASKVTNHKLSKNQILKRLNEIRFAVAQCFNSKEMVCDQQTVSPFKSFNIIIQENESGVQVHSIEYGDQQQQNIPLNINIHVKNTPKASSRDNNEIATEAEKVETEQNKMLVLVFRYNTGYFQETPDNQSDDFPPEYQTSIVNMFNRFFLSIVKSKVIDIIYA